MKTFVIHLLSTQEIWIGKISHEEDLLRTFHTSSIDLLDCFFKLHPKEKKHLELAFGYWILCALERTKYSPNRYGNISNILYGFSPRLGRFLKNEAERVAKKIKIFQKSHR